MATSSVNQAVRYEPDERPPLLLSIGIGLQVAILIIAPVVITVAIVFKIAGQSAEYLAWGRVCRPAGQRHRYGVAGGAGLADWRRAHPDYGNVGGVHRGVRGGIAESRAGHHGQPHRGVVAVSVRAGPHGWRGCAASLPPVVCGTVIMLIAATVMPIIFAIMMDVPEGVPDAAAPVTALATIIVTVGLVLRAPPTLRLWSPIIGIAVGCAVGGGLRDLRRAVRCGRGLGRHSGGFLAGV